jgi:hypothetical protein
MARTMLHEHRTPRRFWAEAVNTACHVGNRIFLRAFLNNTCYELMHGRAPRVSHFRAIGCRCFILKKGRLDKFESRSLLTVYFGTPKMFITLWFGFDYGTNPPLGKLII